MLRYTCTTKIVTDNIIQRTLTQTDFFKLSENDFRGLHLQNLKSLRRYHFILHSHNLTFITFVQLDFGALHLHNLKSLSYGKMTYFTLHSHTLVFITFAKTWFPWLSHSCCVCIFCYIHTYFVLIFMSKPSLCLKCGRRNDSTHGDRWTYEIGNL